MGERVLGTLRHELPGESDEQLTDRARCGDQSAFSELYRRHRKAAESTAWCLLRSRTDADDVVSDAFTGVLSALRNGRGPRDNFRRYLLACVRNGCRKRRSRTVPLPDERLDRLTSDERLDGLAPMLEDPERYVEADTVARAFASLTPRWQHTLWLTEVEQRPTDEVSERMKLTPNATAALAHRARQAFAVAYLAEHVGTVAGTECMKTAPLLAGYVRGQLGAESLLEVERHLVRCGTCAKAASDLRDVNGSLRSLIPAGPAAPIAAGVATVTRATAATVSSTSSVSLGGASVGVSGGLLAKGLVAVLLISPAISADGSAGARLDVHSGTHVAHVSAGTIVDAETTPLPEASPTDRSEPSPAPNVVPVVAVLADQREGPDGGAESDLPGQPAAFERPSEELVGPILGDVPIHEKEIEALVRDIVTLLVTSVVAPIAEPTVQPVTEPVVERLDQALAAMGLGPTGESVRLLGSFVPLLDETLVDLVVDGLLGIGPPRTDAPAAEQPVVVPGAGPAVPTPAAGDDAESATSRPETGPGPMSVEPTDLADGIPVVALPSIGVPSITVPSVTLPANAGPLLGLPAVSIPAVSIPPIEVPIVGIPEITLPVIAIPSLTSPTAAS